LADNGKKRRNCRIINGIKIKKLKSSTQLCSDLDDLPLKSTGFLKKLLIASLNDIISSGLPGPDVRHLLRDSK
jgi:hypothetical protein